MITLLTTFGKSTGNTFSSIRAIVATFGRSCSIFHAQLTIVTTAVKLVSTKGVIFKCLQIEFDIGISMAFCPFRPTLVLTTRWDIFAR